ncbi:hypothetical protein MPER_10166, partial [Moniliophthora perniciosa FA553]
MESTAIELEGRTTGFLSVPSGSKERNNASGPENTRRTREAPSDGFSSRTLDEGLAFPTKHLDFLPPRLPQPYPKLGMSFTSSSHTVIMGENTLSHVHGHQVNGTINAGTVSFNAGQATGKRTEYDE